MLAALAAVLLGGPASAIELHLLRSFPADGPSGLAYDRDACALWVANETSTVRMMDLWGNEVRSFEAPLHRVDAVAVEGDHLLVSDGSGLYQRVSRDGEALGETFRLSANLRDTDGLYVDNATSDFWIADDTAAEVVQIRQDGTTVRRLIGYMQSPQLMEPQGITQDPVHGTILVVDDADASDSLFEFSADGVLRSVTSLAFAGTDAEGITVNAEGSQIFVAFDEGGVIAVFDYMPTQLDTTGEALPSGCLISSLEFGTPPV
jgi:DNA-binding beta-propeller fold protein YncE